MLRRTGDHQPPVGQHDIRLEQVVNRQTEFAREIAVAAAEREARDAGGRDDPRGHGQSKGMRRVIHAALRATGFRPHGAVLRINAHPLHQGKVNHQAVVAAPESWPVVAAAPHRRKEIVLPRKAHGRDDIGDIRAASNQQRPLVNHPVVEPAGFLVLRVAALDQLTAQASLEFVNCGRI